MKQKTSVWSEIAIPSIRPALSGDLSADAAVIGGGLAGILTAHYLSEAGLHTVVLERDRIGSGQTGGTTAKITSQHGLIYRRIKEQFRIETARSYAAANQQAIEDYASLIHKMDIECDFRRCPAFLYTAGAEDGPALLARECEAAAELGIPASITDKTELPFPVQAALRFDSQACFHPLKFLYAVAAPLEIYEQTAVLRAEGNRVVTSCGTVTAKHIVFCCHYPFQNMPGYYFMRMHQERSYVIALAPRAGGSGPAPANPRSTEDGRTEPGSLKPEMPETVRPLNNEAVPVGSKAESPAAVRPETRNPIMNGMYLGIDPDGLSFRSYGQTLLLGGGSHRTGENRTGGRFARLRQSAADYYPQLREAAAWSAQDCIPLDGIPYIGRFSSSTPNWYVATGFQKWGMTSAMAAARLITGLIRDGAHPYEAVFSPQRFSLSASGKTLAQEMLHAAKDLTRRVLAPARGEVDALPKGHGGVVELNGEKCGVYKDENGEIFAVSICCPHLGCQLEWNPDEKSWDCPCHGSRFDYRGRLLDEPAQQDITD